MPKSNWVHSGNTWIKKGFEGSLESFSKVNAVVDALDIIECPGTIISRNINANEENITWMCFLLALKVKCDCWM